jgi:hypothetical protein
MNITKRLWLKEVATMVLFFSGFIKSRVEHFMKGDLKKFREQVLG